MIECLEPRVVLSGGPALTAVNLVGAPTAVTSIVLTFDEPLNPTTAENVLAYSFGKPPLPSSSSDDGITLGDILGFRYPNQHEAAGNRPRLVKNGKIQMASAVYDATNDTVTLTPYAPFKAHNYFRFLRVKGSGSNAIEDMQGNPLNGGTDEVARWTVHQGRTVQYHDTQHDHVTLRLTGPGKLMVFTLGNSKDSDASIFVENATTATTLSGSVKNTTVVFPNVKIAEIEGADGITDDLLTSTMFDVLTTSP